MIPAGIVTALEQGIAAMAPPAFNLTYGVVDVWPPVEDGDPLVYLEFAEESGVNTPGEMVVGRYTMDQLISFRVLVPVSASASADEQAAKVVNDMKALMTSLDPVLRAAGMSFADLQSVSKVYRLVRGYPVQVTVTYNIRFRQSRSNPGG